MPKKEELHAKAKDDLARLFPNRVVDAAPAENEPEPSPTISDEMGDDFDVDDEDDDMEQYSALVEAHAHLFD